MQKTLGPSTPSLFSVGRRNLVCLVSCPFSRSSLGHRTGPSAFNYIDELPLLRVAHEQFRDSFIAFFLLGQMVLALFFIYDGDRGISEAGPALLVGGYMFFSELILSTFLRILQKFLFQNLRQRIYFSLFRCCCARL